MKVKKLHKMSLEEIYLDYINNYATIGLMAEHHGVEYEFMLQLFEQARTIYCTAYPPQS